MAVILETLSVRKLVVLGVGIVIVLCTFFITGGYIAPAPTTVMQHIATICLADKPTQVQDPHECKFFKTLDDARKDPKATSRHIVFAATFPLKGLEMTRWFQFMVASVRLDIDYSAEQPYGTPGNKDQYPVWTFEARLYYKDHNDSSHKWQELATSTEDRNLVCQFKSLKTENDGIYLCEDLPFFELGNVYHKYYLINMLLPVHRNKNKYIGKVSDVNFVEIHQNGGFTRVWFTMKTIVSPITIVMLIWFAKRVKGLSRQPLLLEKTMFILGVVTAFLNLPLEWLTLWVDAPFMLLMTDVRQGLFYAMLMCFWIIFTGEHLLDQSERNKLKVYWRQVGSIGFGSLCLLVFDMCERGYQLHNPFYTIWATELGSNLAYAFIICAGICACVYFLFLCVMVFKVFWNIRGKRASFAKMSHARRLQYEGLIYRFEFLMVMTLLCAALTVIFFIISNVNEASWKFHHTEESTIEISSALYTGIYGMWNTYVLTLMFLYAPSNADFAASYSAEGRDTIELVGEANESGARESIVYAMAGKTAQE